MALLETEAILEEMEAEPAASVAEVSCWLRELTSAPAEEVMEAMAEEAAPAADEAPLRMEEASEAMALEAEPMRELTSEAPGTAGVVEEASWAYRRFVSM